MRGEQVLRVPLRLTQAQLAAQAALLGPSHSGALVEVTDGSTPGLHRWDGTQFLFYARQQAVAPGSSAQVCAVLEAPDGARTTFTLGDPVTGSAWADKTKCTVQAVLLNSAIYAVGFITSTSGGVPTVTLDAAITPQVGDTLRLLASGVPDSDTVTQFQAATLELNQERQAVTNAIAQLNTIPVLLNGVTFSAPISAPNGGLLRQITAAPNTITHLTATAYAGGLIYALGGN